jgi:DNA-binding NtrC family response regulator
MSAILVVDDEEKIRTLLCNALTEKGHTTQNADNGENALALLKSNKFDLIVSDVNMPVMDGVALLKNVKDLRMNIPVIFMTAQGMEQTMKEAVQLGLDGFIEKPFNLNNLMDLINEKLKAKGR